MGFLLNRADGSKIEVSGYRSRDDFEGTTLYEGGSMRSRALPKKVDLRRFMTPVENQARTSSCVANAVAGAYEYLFKRHMGDDGYDVSRLFIYYNGRTITGNEDSDGGTHISAAIEGLIEYGACSEETWPFEAELVNEPPDDVAYDEAAEFLVEDTARVPTDLDQWRRCLAEGYPIVFAVALFNSFDRHRKKGLVPMPTNTEQTREKGHALHAMLCVGYSDKDQVFVVRNSWGKAWGDGGYCYIPYKYLMNPAYNTGDSWMFRRVEVLELDEGAWDDEEELFEGIDGVLAEMSEEEFEDLIDAMGDVQLEVRLALLFLTVASVDGELSDVEADAIFENIERVLEVLGLEEDPEGLINYALECLEADGDLVEESVELLGDNLGGAALAALLEELYLVADADGLDELEDDFLSALVQAWQLDI